MLKIYFVLFCSKPGSLGRNIKWLLSIMDSKTCFYRWSDDHINNVLMKYRHIYVYTHTFSIVLSRWAHQLKCGMILNMITILLRDRGSKQKNLRMFHTCFSRSEDMQQYFDKATYWMKNRWTLLRFFGFGKLIHLTSGRILWRWISTLPHFRYRKWEASVVSGFLSFKFDGIYSDGIVLKKDAWMIACV